MPIASEHIRAFAVCLALVLGTPALATAQAPEAPEEAAPDPGEDAAADADAGEPEEADGGDEGDTVDEVAPEEEVEAEPEPEPEPEEEFEDDWEEPPLFEPRQIDPGLLARARARGAVVYRQYCASCHGTRGDGQGPAARFLQVVPRNFTTGVYKWRTTPSGELPTDGDLLRVIRQGAPGTPMPAWEGRLSIRDIWSVAHYIKTFSPRFAEDMPVGPLPMPDTVPDFNDETRRRGRLMYVLLQCWTCHGMDGTGNGPAADTLVDDEGNPVVAYDFTQNTMRAGNRSIDIYRTYTTGVNGTPMPSYDEAIIVGRDGYEDLSTFEEVMDARGMSALRAFLRQMPLTEELWALSEEERLDWGAQRRWELVAYVESLSGGDSFWRYLWSAPYPN